MELDREGMRESERELTKNSIEAVALDRHRLNRSTRLDPSPAILILVPPCSHVHRLPLPQR